MSNDVTHRERGTTATSSPIGRIDRMFEEWMRAFAGRRGMTAPWDLQGEEVISVDEYRDGRTQVIRAELPGIDPEKDVDLTISDGMLRIDAERRVEQDTEDKGYTRHELRYGRFTRTLPLPDGTTDSDVTATYRDGILEIRVPIPEPSTRQPTRVPISKA